MRARRRIWRELEVAARTEPLSSALQAEADRFTTILIEASHAPALPRRTIALHRLVIVPRTVVGGRTRMALRRKVYTSDALAALDPRVRDFFCEHLAIELDAALAKSRPSVSRPFLTQDTWGCVGYDTEYQWIDPIFSGPGWGGHLVMYEFPRQGLSRRARKELEQTVYELQSSLTNISHIQRQEIIRTAVDGLHRATA